MTIKTNILPIKTEKPQMNWLQKDKQEIKISRWSVYNKLDRKLFKAEIELEILQWKKDNPEPHLQLLFANNSNIKFSDYVELWLPKYAKKHWEPQTCNTNTHNMRNPLLPILGNKILGEITKQDIEEMVEFLNNKKISGEELEPAKKKQKTNP